MKPIKVLFVSRPNLHSQAGGDTLHLDQNRLYLKRLDVKSELWDGSQNPAEFDLIHFYGLSRPATLLPLLHSKVPIVVSSIYVDYTKADRETSRIRAFIQKGLGQHALDYLKLLGRAQQGREEWPNKDYLLEGQKGSIQKILDRADHLITASEAEFEIITKEFNYEGAHSVVRVGTEHLPPLSRSNEKRDVLCVARIEPLKNQLRLIEAQEGCEWKLHLTGDAAPAHQAYLDLCKSQAGPKVLFHAHRNQEECASMFNNAKVHVLPSLYETTGLASLEALHYGCQIVVNDSKISRELFAGHAYFANVENPLSLQEMILKALKKNEDHSAWLHENFSWTQAAQDIQGIYSAKLNVKA